MKHRCPKCGHRWEEPSSNQQAGGKARWRKTTKKQRSEAARAAAKARWASASNTKIRDTRSVFPESTG